MPLMETLQDDFSTGTTPNATRWPSQNATLASVSGGVARITADTSYPVIQSANAYTIANSYLLAKVTPAPLGGTNSSQQSYLSVDLDGNNWTAIVKQGTEIAQLVNVNGVTTQYPLFGGAAVT